MHGVLLTVLPYCVHPRAVFETLDPIIEPGSFKDTVVDPEPPGWVGFLKWTGLWRMPNDEIQLSFYSQKYEGTVPEERIDPVYRSTDEGMSWSLVPRLENPAGKRTVFFSNGIGKSLNFGHASINDFSWETNSWIEDLPLLTDGLIDLPPPEWSRAVYSRNSPMT